MPTSLRALALCTLLLTSALFLGCAANSGFIERRSFGSVAVPMEGKASWYGGKFHGRTTANGETYDKNAMTAAHLTMPFNTRVRVINLESGESMEVRINDRMPQVSVDKGRVIDLSEGAFSKLAPTARGLIPVRLEVVP